MRLVRVHLANYRCFSTPVSVDVDDLTVLIGRNDSGKSSILDALEIFFDESKKPDVDDACVTGDRSAVRIGCEFDELPAQLVLDAEHPTTLRDEHLLTEGGTLRIDKVWDCAGKAAGKVKVYVVCDHPTHEHAVDLLNLTITKLKSRAKAVEADLDDVNESIKTELRNAIRLAVGDLAIASSQIEVNGEVATAWKEIQSRLPLFNLFRSDRPSTDQDGEAQDPMRAAIREAVGAAEEDLKEIEEVVTEAVRDIAKRTVLKVQELDPQLASQLSPRITTKKWDTLFSVSLTDEAEVPINKRGSGVRRLILLSFFRAKAERDAAETGRRVIYAVEEPETSQHPHNQRMVVGALQELAEQPDVQVLVTTHTPVLARRVDSKSLRFVSRDAESGREIQPADSPAVLEEIASSLGVLPDHTVRAFVGVEGRHDIDFLRAVSSKLCAEGVEGVPDVAAEEASGRLVFIPMGGSSLDLWVSRMDPLKRPQFHIMDRDAAPPEPATYENIAASLNAKEGCTAWTTDKRELENYLHPDAIREFAEPTYAGTGDDFEDVPLLLAQAVHAASESETLWEELDLERQRKKESQAKRRLNGDVVRGMTVAQFMERDSGEEVRGWLRAIGAALADE